jgi:membrane protein
MGMRLMFRRIRTAMSAPSHEMAAMLSRPDRAALYLARLGLRIIKQWVRDRCPQQAAALTYQTTLGLVPLLALVFAVLRQTHNLEAQSRLVEFISTQALPDMGDVVSELASFSEKVATGAAGGLGLAFTLATCYFLYDTVENTFNDIWHVTARRSWFRKFLIFYPVVTLLPVLAGAYLYWSGRLIGSGQLARFFGPLSIQFGALFLINWLLPNIRVRFHAAVAGTLVTGFALEGLKWGFVHFAKGMLLSSYTGVYGPLALVPLVLLWIYISWWVVLGGAEIANTIQNLRLLEAEERRHRDDEPINGLVAAQVLAFVAADYQRGGKGIDRASLGHEFGLSVEVIDHIAARLKDQGFLAEVQGDKEGFIPGRAADSISLQEVLAAFRSTDLEAAPGSTSPTLAALIEDLEEARQARIGGITIAELMPK